MKRALFLCVMMNLLFGCVNNKIFFDQKSIKKHQNKGYTFLLNGKRINRDSLYLDKRNIKSVRKSREDKTIDAEQLNINSTYLTLKQIKGDSLPKCILYVVNGLPLKEGLVVEKSAIKAVSYISEQKGAEMICHNCQFGVTVLVLF
ncbi:hypothetical protein [Flavobacterium cheonanense]